MDSTDKKEVQEARVGQAVAENVAVGMAVEADREQARADALAAQNTRQAVRIEETRSERDFAATNGAIARESARS